MMNVSSTTAAAVEVEEVQDALHVKLEGRVARYCSCHTYLTLQFMKEAGQTRRQGHQDVENIFTFITLNLVLQSREGGDNNGGFGWFLIGSTILDEHEHVRC